MVIKTFLQWVFPGTQMGCKSFIGDMNTEDFSMELKNGQVGKEANRGTLMNAMDNLAQSCNNSLVMTANSLSCLQ